MSGIALRLPKLHSAQQQIVDEARRFNCVVCGRRWGKTLLGMDRAIWPALSGGPVGFFTPTYKAGDESWRGIRKATVSMQRSVSVQHRRIELYTDGVIEFWSLDDLDAGRGRKYARVIVDEASMVSNLEESWQAAIFPTLTDLHGDAFLFSTPRGFDYFQTLYERGQDPAHPEWRSWLMPTATNPILQATEPTFLQTAQATMDPRYFAQEYGASFEEMAGRVYFQFSREANVRADLVDTGGPLLVGMDFNVAPMSAVVAIRAGDELHVIDELELADSNTEEMCQALKHRYAGRSVTVCPDPSGSARKTSAPVGQTDFAIIRRAGFRVAAPNKAPPVVDRINEVQALLCSASGRRRLLFHPRCRSSIRCFMQLTYKDGKGGDVLSVVDKSAGLDHLCDAVGYLVHMEFPIIHRGGGPVVYLRG